MTTININKIHLIGRAGSDPNTLYFDSGHVKSTVGIAVKRPNKKDDNPDWFDLIFWDKTAEIAGKYVRKGSQIGVSGYLVLEMWIDKTGKENSKWKVKVDRLTLLTGSKDAMEDDGSEE